MPRPTRPTLTARQQKIYDFIVAFKREHDGNAPTIRQIGDAVGISSTSMVFFQLDKLVRLNKIRRQGHMIFVAGGNWNIEKVFGDPFQGMPDNKPRRIKIRKTNNLQLTTAERMAAEL